MPGRKLIFSRGGRKKHSLQNATLPRWDTPGNNIIYSNISYKHMVSIFWFIHMLIPYILPAAKSITSECFAYEIWLFLSMFLLIGAIVICQFIYKFGKNWANWIGNILFSALLCSAQSLQSCPTLCNPIEGSLPGSPAPGILQARTLEWVAISFSNSGKWKVKVKLLSRVRLLVTPWTAAHQAPPSMGFSRQEYWSGVPLPSPILFYCSSFHLIYPTMIYT